MQPVPVIRFPALVALVAAATCAAPTRTADSQAEFTLGVRESAALRGTSITVTVDSIVEDSRCPVDVQCVWAGNAKVRLRLRDGQAASVADVNTTTEPHGAAVGGRTITLVSVAPAPRQDVAITQRDYRVRLRFD